MLRTIRAVKSKVAPNLVINRTPLDRQINDLRAENLLLQAERDELRQHKEHTWNRRHADRMLHHQPHRISGHPGIVDVRPDPDDMRLVARVADAYRKSVRTPVGPTDSMWLNEFAAANNQTHKVLESGNLFDIAKMLRNPATSMLFYGFDTIQSADAIKNDSDGWVRWNHQLTYDSLLQVCRAIGARRQENPEAAIEFDDAPSAEEILEQLDEKMGFRIEFPNFFPGEVGLQTSRGVANFRAAQALFQAWRIKQLVGDSEAKRVLEIGAGLGRTAYYAMKMGVQQYTIIDIPLTGVAQGYYLGRALGEDAVSLYGENRDAQVKVLPPVAYKEMDEKFDLIVNVDSLTEMAESTATEYLIGAAHMTRQFLSINHEHNAFTVESIYRNLQGTKAWRAPYWLRRGYVEELIEFTDASRS
ncbi:putative sugar O-methyltransferase [Paraburkholderia sediminicola]|uniref:putative sugar O-methyltransferase n=1 Tax=Paraburkholderia sediminicola TaxID=458836 RepID=UPI0038BD7C3E